jgi:hypothetical protein
MLQFSPILEQNDFNHIIHSGGFHGKEKEQEKGQAGKEGQEEKEEVGSQNTKHKKIPVLRLGFFIFK